jgi:hypothetical protein
VPDEPGNAPEIGEGGPKHVHAGARRVRPGRAVQCRRTRPCPP